MTVVAFPSRAPIDKDRRYKVLLKRDDATRLYQILPAGHQHWQCWIRSNAKPYLSICTDDTAHLDRIRAEFERDVAGLKADGWTEL